MSVIIDIMTVSGGKNEGLAEEVPQGSFHKHYMMENTKLIHGLWSPSPVCFPPLELLLLTQITYQQVGKVLFGFFLALFKEN